MTRFSCLGIASILVACGTAKTRDATAPLSPAAQKVEVVKEAKATCKKLGSAKARGKDADEKVADQQALDAAKEEAVKLGGDTLVLVTQTNEPEAGSGGTVMNLTKTVDVFSCGAK